MNINTQHLIESYPNIQGFYSVSCTRETGIQEFKEALVEQLQRAGVAQTKFNRAHFKVLQELQEVSRKEQFFAFNKFQELCEEQGITDEGELNRQYLLEMLDKLGVVIHFPNINWLDDFILNPRWLTYGVYQVLYSDKAKDRQGRITESEIAEILQDKIIKDNSGFQLHFPRDRIRLIVDAMREFQICFRTPDHEENLILPDLLPSDRPVDLEFGKQGAMRFDFDFKTFLPRHIMTNLIVMRHEEIYENRVWQNGVRLKSAHYRDTHALVEADYHKRILSLWITGMHVGRYFDVLHNIILDKIKKMERLKYVEMLWLPEEAREENTPLPVEVEPRFKFRDLLAMEAEGVPVLVTEHGKYNLKKVMKVYMSEESREKGGMNINVNGNAIITEGGITGVVAGNAPGAAIGAFQNSNIQIGDNSIDNREGSMTGVNMGSGIQEISGQVKSIIN